MRNSSLVEVTHAEKCTGAKQFTSVDTIGMVGGVLCVKKVYREGVLERIEVKMPV